MGNTFEEGTIPFTLDKLDYEVNMIGGFTSKELGVTTAVVMLVSLPVGCVVSWLAFDIWMLGLVVGTLAGGLVTAKLSFKAYTLKNGRPSYMLWVDVKIWIQKHLRINCGFVESTYWSINATNNKDKQ